MLSGLNVDLKELVVELSSGAYTEIAEGQLFPQTTDMSKSNMCHLLTYVVMEALNLRGLPVQREYHSDYLGNWHYVIAHKELKTPSDDDVITDLNPWQWRQNGGEILHGTRSDVMRLLKTAGAPEFFVALRGIETITLPHDTRKYPYIYQAAS